MEENGTRLDHAVSAREGEALALLGRLIAARSLPLEEGRRDEPESAVGILAGALDAIGVPFDAVPTGPRSETLIARLGGGPVDGPTLILDAHIDTVPPGDSQEWEGLDPLRAHEGVATYLGGERVRIDVEGRSVERQIRTRLARVWDARGGGARRIISGRGAFDNKGPVAVQWLTLAAVADLLRAEILPSGQVIAVFSTDEEQSESGIRAAVEWLRARGYLDRPPAPDGYLAGIAGIVLEGSYSYLPVAGHRGRALFAVRTAGKAAHAATPHLGRNAVLAMARLLAAMERDWPSFAIRLPDLFDDGLLEGATAAIGTTIAGGGVRHVEESPAGSVVRRGGTNVVPDWCEATIDLRYPRGRGYPNDSQTLPLRILEMVGEWIASLEPGTTVTLLSASPPAAIGRTAGEALRDPLIAAVVAARTEALGLPAYIETAPGGTNGTALIHRARIRTLVECGPGGALSHEPFEFVDVADIAAGARILARVALQVLSGQPVG